VLLLALSLTASAAPPLPLADSGLTRVRLASAEGVRVVLDRDLAACTLSPIGLHGPDASLDGRLGQVQVTDERGALLVALGQASSLPGGTWTLLLQGAARATAAGGGPPAVDPCDQVWALTLDVPAADLRPVEARLELTRIAPMTYDLPFQVIFDKVGDLLCARDEYPQCVDAKIRVPFHEAGGLRRVCDFSPVVSVERWGEGINADEPARAAGVLKPATEQTLTCVEPGASVDVAVQLPDNVPLGTSELTLNLRAPAAAEVAPVPVVVHVRRGLVWLFLFTIAGAALKLIHKALLPALRDAKALQVHIEHMERVEAELSPGAGGSVAAGGLGSVSDLRQQSTLGLLRHRAASTEQVRIAHEALQGKLERMDGGHEAARGAAPALPALPVEKARPLSVVVIETLLGMALLCFFVYVSYATSFVGTASEFAAILAFAYAANLGLDPLMSAVTLRAGNLSDGREGAGGAAGSASSPKGGQRPS
jgi:hypothetical protein